jgi:uncharacterized protein YbaR (Trm112 family)
MKIIKNAMTTPIEITCPECKSVLEYTYNDIQRREENTIFGLYAGVKRYIVCPVCKGEIDIRYKVEVKEADND